MPTPAFITGSHAYGEATDDSDVDLVIRINPTEAIQLMNLLSIDPSESYGEGTMQFTVGKLNLILAFTDSRYGSWLEGTGLLRANEYPVDRDTAVNTFKQLFSEEG